MNRINKIQSIEFTDKPYTLSPETIQCLLKKIFDKEIIDNENFENESFSIQKEKIGRRDYLKVSFLNTDKYISFFTGNGTAIKRVHIDTVVELLKINGFTDRQIECFLLVFYGDGSTDGNCLLKMKSSEIKKNFKREISILNKAMHKIKSQIVDFALLQMPDGNQIDGILFIDDDELHYASTESIEKYVKKKNIAKTSVLNVAFIGIQSYSRLSSNPKERDMVQFKLHHISETIKDIQKFTKLKNGSVAQATGCCEEQKQVITMNRNRNSSNKQWVELINNARAEGNIFDESNVYAISLTRFYKALNRGKKIQTKSDMVLVHIEKEINDLLLKNNYFLTDTILLANNIDFKFLKGTGVSIKQGNCTTICRMRLKYAQEYFNSEDLANGVLFQDEQNFSYNKKIYKQCHLNPRNVPQTVDEVCLAHKTGQQNISNTIANNIEVRNALITGEGVFEDDIVVHYMMWDGRLKKVDTESLKIVYNSAGQKKKGIIPIFQTKRHNFEQMKGEVILS